MKRRSGSQHEGLAPRSAPGRNDLGLVLAAALAATLVAGSMLVLVGVRTAQVQTGYRVHDLRSEVIRLRQERAALDVEKGALLRPSRMAELARTRLDLVPVDAARALSLTMPMAPTAPHRALPAEVQQ